MASLINSAGATGTGSMTIQGPNTNSNQVLTIPDATGTAMVSGNMPAFSAYQSSAQTLSSATFTKITFTTKVFDTNNNFASSTFTPTVAGYYQINCGISIGTTATVIILLFYKNGSTVYKAVNTNPSTVSTVSASNLVYLNGTTDYVEVYAFLTLGQALSAASTDTYFSGSLMRAA
jgi:hypothetical protein